MDGSRGLTQAQAAKRLGVVQPCISMFVLHATSIETTLRSCAATLFLRPTLYGNSGASERAINRCSAARWQSA